ncbi:MAG: hypothetical protein LLG01_18055 [Planctomycetaceae bacterium]|nr:hypothetical protein [Planctomycetaceae bacterium]
MLYAAFVLWLLLIVFLGTGVYRLWAGMTRPAWVNWALLPGTLVAEMAYIFGCLITGGEIRHARLMPADSSKGAAADGEPATDASPRLKVLGPIIASLLALAACAAAILGANALLGEAVLDQFARQGATLPKALPTGWDAFWKQLSGQVSLLKATCEMVPNLDWLNWRVPLFAYLALCLSVRLGPVRRDLRATLAAAVVVALVIAVIAALNKKFSGLMEDLWPLLGYIYATLLLTLLASLMIKGIIALTGVVRGGEKRKSRAA